MSKEKRNHLVDLEETFSNIKKAGLHLKAKKCTFGVTKGQFFRFQIMPQGIKARQEKIEVMKSMEPPKMIKWQRGVT